MAENAQIVKSGTNGDTSRENEEKASQQGGSITMDKRVDIALAVGIALLGFFFTIASRSVREGQVPDPFTSRGLPITAGALLIICGIILAVRQLLHWSELPGNLVPEEGQVDEEGYPASWVRAFSIIVLSVLWEWLLKPLGFLLVTPPYLLLASWCMGVRSWKKLIGFSIIYTVVSWAAFVAMGVRLPLGPLTHFALSLGIIV